MLMQILQLAPSAQPRIFWQLALVPLTGTGATESMQITWVEAVASGPNDGNNAREWRAVSVRERAQLGGRTVIGAFHPYEVSQTSSMKIQNEKRDSISELRFDLMTARV